MKQKPETFLNTWRKRMTSISVCESHVKVTCRTSEYERTVSHLCQMEVLEEEVLFGFCNKQLVTVGHMQLTVRNTTRGTAGL